MKVNWGLGIAIFYGSFMAILLFFVIRSFQYDHSLVMENYYEQDLNYQEHYEKKRNALAMEKDFTIELSSDKQSLLIRFLKQNINPSGAVTFFRPADQTLDLEMPLQLDDTQEMPIPTSALLPGRWVVQLDWQQKDSSFYYEKEILIP